MKMKLRVALSTLLLLMINSPLSTGSHGPNGLGGHKRTGGQRNDNATGGRRQHSAKAARPHVPVVCQGPCRCSPAEGLVDCAHAHPSSLDFIVGHGKHAFTVKRVVLSGNRLLNITEPAKFLSHYKSTIEYLDLSSNQMSFLTHDTFKGFKRLKHLNLSENALRNGTVWFHADLQTSLEQLYLENNRFVAIDNSTFENLDNLRTLSLSRNKFLFKFANHPFARMHRLAALMLDACAFERWLPDIQLKGLSRLEHLSVQRNKLSVLPAGAFRDVPQLRTLDLAFNHLTELQPLAFAHVERLEELHLNDMAYLWAVEEYAFAGLRRLKVLNLNDCPSLYDIDPLAFGRNVSFATPIDTVDLQNNNLATWSGSGLFSYLSMHQVRRLKLNGNPWMCDCRIAWMLDVPADVVTPKQGPKCALPSYLKDQLVLSLDKSQLNCLPTSHIGRAALFFLFVFTLSTVLAAAWFLYTTNKCRSPSRRWPSMTGAGGGNVRWSPMRLVRAVRPNARAGARAADGPDFGYKNLVLRAEEPEDAVQMEGVERSRADSYEQDAFEVVSNSVGTSPNDTDDRPVQPAFV